MRRHRTSGPAVRAAPGGILPQLELGSRQALVEILVHVDAGPIVLVGLVGEEGVKV